jgi:mannose-6-phosphate isomerase-like protein (cupin superfamily)
MLEAVTVHSQHRSSYVFLGVKMTILLSSQETGGQFSLIEGIMPPGGDGGRHVHAKEDESMHLLEGELEVSIGDQVFTLRAGESYFAPRNVPQRLRNLGSVPARAMLMTTPGGFDEFIAKAATPIKEGGSPDALSPSAGMPDPSKIHALLELATEYGITILEPPVAPQA